MLKRCYHELKFNSYMDKRFIRRTFTRKLGYPPNLSCPESFNEKLQWIKLNCRDPIYSQLADKISVRDFVSKKIGDEFLIPLVQSCNRPEEITANSLPDYPVVIKTNHASGQVFIVKDRNDFDYGTMYKELNKLLSYNFYHACREWHYKNIPASVMVEKFIPGNAGNAPNDYKFHCFKGVPTFIQVDTDRFSEHKRVVFCPKWKRQDFQFGFPAETRAVEKPGFLSSMMDVTTQLSVDFEYIRVDLYATKERVYFGELTFTPEAGFGTFTPQKIDYDWGKLFDHTR